jgi:hypothetical protein
MSMVGAGEDAYHTLKCAEQLRKIPFCGWVFSSGVGKAGVLSRDFLRSKPTRRFFLYAENPTRRFYLKASAATVLIDPPKVFFVTALVAILFFITARARCFFGSAGARGISSRPQISVSAST